jgi:hypothetical protein
VPLQRCRPRHGSAATSTDNPSRKSLAGNSLIRIAVLTALLEVDSLNSCGGRPIVLVRYVRGSDAS